MHVLHFVRVQYVCWICIGKKCAFSTELVKDRIAILSVLINSANCHCNTAKPLAASACASSQETSLDWLVVSGDGASREMSCKSWGRSAFRVPGHHIPGAVSALTWRTGTFVWELTSEPSTVQVLCLTSTLTPSCVPWSVSACPSPMCSARSLGVPVPLCWEPGTGSVWQSGGLDPNVGAKCAVKCPRPLLLSIQTD